MLTARMCIAPSAYTSMCMTNSIQTLPVMVALGTWGMTHRETSPELTIRSRLMTDDPQLVSGLMEELRETHLGVPRPDPASPRASERLQAAVKAEIAGS